MMVVQRMSTQRRVIFDKLCSVSSHPTANEIYDLVRGCLPNISLGTVYRNLELLCREGVIKKIVGEGSQMRYDAMVEAHHHIICVRCGKVDDVLVEKGIVPAGIACKAEGYELLGYRLEFLGRCASCKGKLLS
jgi:Fur family transcriptional regulator, ferric uptake regulator